MGVASENWGAHEEPDVLSVESLMRGDDLPNVSSPDKPFSLDEHRQRLGRDTSFERTPTELVSLNSTVNTVPSEFRLAG